MAKGSGAVGVEGDLCVTNSILVDHLECKTATALTVGCDLGINGDLCVTNSIFVDHLECKTATELTVGCDLVVNGTLDVIGHIKLDGMVIHPSDKRIKQGIKPLSDAEHLKSICMLEPVSYKFIEEFCGVAVEKQTEQIGLIAQDVEQAVPHVVVSGLARGVGDKSIDDFRAIDYSRLTVPLIGAVKALSTELTAVKELAEEMRNELDALKAESAPAA